MLRPGRDPKPNPKNFAATTFPPSFRATPEAKKPGGTPPRRNHDTTATPLDDRQSATENKCASLDTLARKRPRAANVARRTGQEIGDHDHAKEKAFAGGNEVAKQGDGSAKVAEQWQSELTIE